MDSLPLLVQDLSCLISSSLVAFDIVCGIDKLSLRFHFASIIFVIHTNLF